MVDGAEVVRACLRVVGLREAVFLKSDGEGLQRVAARARHEAGDDGRVESPRKKCPDRHVGDHVRPDGVIELFPQPLDEFGARRARGGVRGDGPERPTRVDLPLAAREQHALPGLEAEHLAVDRPGRRHGEPGKVVRDRGRVYLAADRAGREERGHLGGE